MISIDETIKRIEHEKLKDSGCVLGCYFLVKEYFIPAFFDKNSKSQIVSTSGLCQAFNRSTGKFETLQLSTPIIEEPAAINETPEWNEAKLHIIRGREKYAQNYLWLDEMEIAAD